MKSVVFTLAFVSSLTVVSQAHADDCSESSTRLSCSAVDSVGKRIYISSRLQNGLTLHNGSSCGRSVEDRTTGAEITETLSSESAYTVKVTGAEIVVTLNKGEEVKSMKLSAHSYDNKAVSIGNDDVKIACVVNYQSAN